MLMYGAEVDVQEKNERIEEVQYKNLRLERRNRAVKFERKLREGKNEMYKIFEEKKQDNTEN